MDKMRLNQSGQALYFKPLPGQFIKYSIRITQQDINEGCVKTIKLLNRFQILKMPG